MTTMDGFESAEFEAMLESVLEERVQVAAPAGLQQRLMARMELATERAAELARRESSSVQFSHFGVLRDGEKSKGAFLTSAFANLAVLALLVIVGNAVKNEVMAPKEHVATLVEPVKEQPVVKPPVEKIPPPVVSTEQPVVERAKVELPPDVHPVIAPNPKVNLDPPAARRVDPPQAPKAISLAAKAAAIPNSDPKPSAVRLGRTDSPLKPGLSGPPVSPVNLAAGMPGMNVGNSGNGPASKNVRLGSGSPNSANVNGRSTAAVPVTGLAKGIIGGIGKGSNGVVRVEIPQAVFVRPSPVAPSTVATLAKAPVVTFVPKPVYSAEAKALHLEGDATIRVRFLANGSVQVLGVARGLGHGLDEAALQVAQGIRFRPATDSTGKPVDYPTTITVHFLMN
jgi:protein TonB